MTYPKYYDISANDLEKGAKIPFTVVDNAGEMHFEYALQMMETIVQNNASGKNTVFIGGASVGKRSADGAFACAR